ncbi:MAG: phosphoenolpyruvate hydrolase family protein [Pararhodobacter sp.]|nr:phosphoenolpyruvate hydrolase family protein [Pararhodobacter sp.]
MSNTASRHRDLPLPDLLIRVSVPRTDIPGESTQAQIVAPWLAGLEPAQRDLLSLLPVLDVNGAVFSALQEISEERERATVNAAVQPGSVAALFCADPFLRVRDAAALLRAAGIEGVANFPTIQVIDGVAARGFDSADLGTHREAEVLANFAREGLDVTGFATSAQNGRLLLDHGATSLVVHPGPASKDWRARTIAARAAEATLTALRADCTVPLRLYCADGYGGELDAARALADGLVRHG